MFPLNLIALNNFEWVVLLIRQRMNVTPYNIKRKKQAPPPQKINVLFDVVLRHFLQHMLVKSPEGVIWYPLWKCTFQDVELWMWVVIQL